MEAYFDAHVYVANWGTRILMLRLPRASVDEEALRHTSSTRSWTIGRQMSISLSAGSGTKNR